jgi:hypothetical protein
MPMLPSGRHVALDPRPLQALLADAEYAPNIHHVMALKTWPDLMKWIGVLILVPESQAGEDRIPTEFSAQSLPLPEGLVAIPGGFRLDKLDKFTRDWSAEDRAAMREFVDGRARAFFDTFLESAEVCRSRLRQGSLDGRVLSRWYELGVHPAQEEGWDADDSPEWDTYDALAALSSALAAMRSAKLPAGYDEPRMRIGAFWNIALQQVPGLGESADGASPRRVAAGWREQGLLDRGDPERIHAIREQAVTECSILWQAGEEWRTLAPAAYAIVELVELSRAGDKS